MQTIFVQVKCEMGKVYDVANDAIEVEPVSEVHSISGRFDLMIKCYLDDDQDIGHFVTESLQTLDGVADTYTTVAFKAFT